MYRESDLVCVAKRLNNKKRGYLVVNRLQGKHIPVRPAQALELFESLADVLQGEYGRDSLLLVGFAETATAIGAAVAAALGCRYMQTTREKLDDVDWLYFSESHSHATQQKLVREDVEKAAEECTRIVFVEDEVTTGNTIGKIVQILKERYPGKFQYSVASVLNGMKEADLKSFCDLGISVHYLVKTDHEGFEKIAAGYPEDGKVVDCVGAAGMARKPWELVPGRVDARRLVDSTRMRQQCERLGKAVLERYPVKAGERILVLGTEEFMYPPLCIAAWMERKGADVSFHATTRSPIAVSADESYPFQCRYELCSFYDGERATYLYDLDKYDQVYVVTDAWQEEEAGTDSLAYALSQSGNFAVHWIRWENE